MATTVTTDDIRALAERLRKRADYQDDDLGKVAGMMEWVLSKWAEDTDRRRAECDDCGCVLGDGDYREDGYCVACYLARYGSPETQNPYPAGTQSHDMWNTKRRAG